MAGRTQSSVNFSSASDRNKQPIFEQLKRLLPAGACVLEIGSGWGQHAVFFSESLPTLEWQPTDRPEALPELGARLLEYGNASIKAPIPLDVLKNPFPSVNFDAVYSANTAHIMSWQGVEAMFSGTGKCLKPGSIFCLYGPFNIGGSFTSESNRQFDSDLKARKPEMGIRDIEALEILATSHQMILRERNQMPANNLLLVFEKAQNEPG
ncbi:MAG: cyclopropane fatty-acyl-phospholipid synthase-like methyltransferase [Lysobacterales bacterium]|jgi:cyclopropane fatty-acyl-phospholipid synthase-like methyltransferase